MRLWGLTGGIASGKSTAASLFAARGANLLNADTIYHGLLAPHGDAPSELAQKVAATFPELHLLRSDGTLDRRALGARVFHDAAARQLLESVTHPAVASAVLQAMQDLRDAGVAHVVYDVPLLYEKRRQGDFHGVVVVWVPRDVQLQRLMARDGLAAEAARARLDAQMPLDEKRRQATWVVDNSGDRETTARQVDAVWNAMLQYRDP